MSRRSKSIVRPGAESASREQVRTGPRQHRLGVSTAACRQSRFAIARTSARARRSLPAHSQQPGQPLPIGFVPLWGLPVSADPEAVYSGSGRRGCPCLLPEVKNRVGRKNKLNDSPGVQLFASPQSKELRKTRLSPKGLGCRCGFQEDRKTVACGGGTGGRAVLSGSSSPAISSNPPNNPVWEVFAGEETETGLGEVTCSGCRLPPARF